jgi:hypothetical protein
MGSPDVIWCWLGCRQLVTTSTLAEPKRLPPGLLKSTKIWLLGLLAMAAVAVTKTENVGVAPLAKGATVTVGAGAAMHWPVEGLVWQSVT